MLLRHPFRQQGLLGADFAGRTMAAAITIEQILMTLRLVTSAIAMQFRQQRRILLRKFVRFLYRTDELVGVERQTLLRRVGRDGLCLRQPRAAAMTRDAHRPARAAILRRLTAERW